MNQAEIEGLSEKSEFHLTLIGSRTGEAILEKLNLFPEDKKKQLLNKIEQLAQDLN
ncbi:MAG: hypothetical protein WDZ40_03590 [Candidatus Spechtbacterales bacterium]